MSHCVLYCAGFGLDSDTRTCQAGKSSEDVNNHLSCRLVKAWKVAKIQQQLQVNHFLCFFAECVTDT